jgi:hypothetical protein
MKTWAVAKLAALAAVACALFLTSGCDMKDDKSSTDLAELRKLVDLQLPVKAGRWEVFGTPEYSGGVPGPTYLITLIAQIDMTNDAQIESGPSSGAVSIAPEAARTWISEPFRSLLAEHQNDEIDVSRTQNCRQFRALLHRGRKPVEGFICKHSDKWLVYLTLWSEIQS